MSNVAGELERALEELIRRVLREEMAAMPAARPAPAASASPAPAPSSGPGLAAVSQAVAGILQPASQTDIMAATLRAALALAGRCALFVRRGENFSVWRAEGYAGQTAAALRAVTVSAAQPGIFKDLSDTMQPVCRQRMAAVLPPALEQALGSAAGPRVSLLPVVVQGKVVAALYSDAGGSSGSDEMSGLEILAKVAGLSLETAGSRAQPDASRPAAAASESSAEVRLETPAAAPSRSAVASPGSDGPPSRGSFAETFPVAIEGAPALPPPPDADALPEAERDSHKKAHRFARVAVQDLLSYHRDKIEQGRRNRNLFTLLKEDIEKTRENYQKRFGETPARAFDYLHYEMVSKLAGNDAGVLGDQYPGPWAGQ
jgi:hypothetical protein